MSRSSRKAPIIGGLVLALGLLTGCSALRLGYRQAPELLYWWIDGYVDIGGEQAPRVREALAQWLAWHRRTQLPEYAALLARAQAEVQADATPRQACAWWQALRGQADLSLEHAVPLVADLLPTLSPSQIDHVERRYAKGNEDFRADFLQNDPAQRLRESVRRTVDRAEFFYGRLDEAQRELVASRVAASPFDPERWLAEREQRQQEALRLLRRLQGERSRPDQIQAGLRAYLQHLGRSPRESYRRYGERLQDYNCAFAAQLHNTTSAAQRQAAAQRLKGWEGDLRSLAADAPR